MSTNKSRVKLTIIAIAAILLGTFVIQFNNVGAYANVTDLPFLGAHTVTCTWHESCIDPITPGKGIDFGMNYGEAIYASGPGSVYSSGWSNDGWGYQVVVRHPDGSGGYYYTRYAHLAYYFPPAGGVVGNGSPIGYADSTGSSTGNHLHFEMYHNGLSSANSIYFTPIYGVRASGTTYGVSDFENYDSVTHDRWDGTTPVVDDKDSNFSLVSTWWTAAYGFDRNGLSSAQTRWTYSNGSVVDSKAFWRPNIPSSRNYAIYAFIPEMYATTTNAHYVIKSGATTTHKYINQSPYYNDWVYLGTFYGSAGVGNLTVELRDDTGESPGSKYIAADVIMFVPN